MQFVYTAYALGVEGNDVNPTPLVEFTGTPEEALGFFFSKGYNFSYEEPIFANPNGRVIYQEFDVAEEGFPARMNIALGLGANEGNEIDDIRNYTHIGIRREVIQQGGKTRRNKTKKRKTRARKTRK